MKIWTSEHTFGHPWETVVSAACQKYPNPLNPNVIGLDVIDRSLERNTLGHHVLRSHRLMCTSWGAAKWMCRIFNSDGTCMVDEKSVVDPASKTMTLTSRNLSLKNFLSFEERITYEIHPEDSSKTLLKQSAIITVSGVPLTDYFEGVLANNISNNAGKGRQAIEWVIQKLKSEAHDLTRSAENLSKNVDKMLETRHHQEL